MFLLAAGAGYAHVMSMSSGDLLIEGATARYELRMPSYEVAHVKDPERTLLDHIRFTGAGSEARLVSHACRDEGAGGSYVCQAGYEFAAPVESVEVECTFHSVTVPNHVHLLRAVNGGKRDQAIFDFSFPRAALRFRPPSAFETAVSQGAAGAGRAAGGMVQVLFLATLVLAARSRRELCAISGMFLAGQISAAIALPWTRWQPAPRFVEAATALTLAYLATEILLLPQTGMRWLVAGVLGIFHGLYFALFLQTSGYAAGWVLAGAVITEAALIAVFAAVFAAIRRWAGELRPVQVCASALVVVGLGWFFLRLRG